MRTGYLLASVLFCGAAAAQQPSVPSASLTIYNQNYALARMPMALDLHAGLNHIASTEMTSQLEPNSALLLDAPGKQRFQILEQSYDAGVVSQEWMLRKYEGRTIGFEVPAGAAGQGPQVVEGKIIRAGANGGQPLIEVNGQLEFRLPGTPLFPASDHLPLQPTLHWLIQSGSAQKLTAELAYITGGLTWEANYNVVLAAGGSASEEKAELKGRVTIHNTSGTDFPDARVQLMAGDVAKMAAGMPTPRPLMMRMAAEKAAPEVTQSSFSDFHLYDLHRPVTLLQGETKQVQFLSAANVTVHRVYRYDGAPQVFQPIYTENAVNMNPALGAQNANTRVEVVEQFRNSQANELGVPLPAGQMRLYRRDSEGQMQFIGESSIGHTPAEQTVSVTTGSAFDVRGSRKQTDFSVNQAGHELRESFAIGLTNQKAEPVTVEVVEHLNRGNNWQITQKLADYTKIDSHTIQFAVTVPAKGSATVTYTAQYTW